MTRKNNCAKLALAALCAIPAMATSQMYAASGSNGVNGHLYTINPATGAMITDVGALMNATGAPFGLTGMAFMGGTLYGTVSNASPTGAGTLVSINPFTAQVTSIGTFFAAGGGTMSDITSIGGTLYGWRSNADHSLYTINTTTGAASIVGAGSGNPGFGGGGLAANAAGTMFVSPNGSFASSGFTQGSFYTVNTTTGALTSLGVHSGLSGVINAMTFDGATLYGINGDQGGPSLTNLVTINPANGAVTVVGPSINDLDAIAVNPVPEPATMAVLGIGALALLRRRRK